MIDALYILSSARAGSTLLNLILGSHPDAIAVGELTHLPKNLALNSECTCGEPVWQCQLWSRVVNRLSEVMAVDLRHDPYALELGFIRATRVVDHRRLTKAYRAKWKLRHGAVYASYAFGLPLPPVVRTRFDDGIANTLKLYDAIRETTASRLIVDSSKSYLKGLALYKNEPERIRLILLSRDGRAVMYSQLKSGAARKRSIDTWQTYYERALPLLERLVPPRHLMHVRYEDLVASPGPQVQRICEFAGIEFDPAMLEFGHKMHHIANGNDMRFRPDKRITPDLTWHAGLNDDDRKYFEARAGGLNRRFGYQ